MDPTVHLERCVGLEEKDEEELGSCSLEDGSFSDLEGHSDREKSMDFLGDSYGLFWIPNSTF